VRSQLARHYLTKEKRAIDEVGFSPRILGSKRLHQGLFAAGTGKTPADFVRVAYRSRPGSPAHEYECRLRRGGCVRIPRDHGSIGGRGFLWPLILMAVLPKTFSNLARSAALRPSIVSGSGLRLHLTLTLPR